MKRKKPPPLGKRLRKKKDDPAKGLNKSSDDFQGIPLLDAITDPDDRAQVKAIMDSVNQHGMQS